MTLADMSSVSLVMGVLTLCCILVKYSVLRKCFSCLCLRTSVPAACRSKIYTKAIYANVKSSKNWANFTRLRVLCAGTVAFLVAAAS